MKMTEGLLEKLERAKVEVGEAMLVIETQDNQMRQLKAKVRDARNYVAEIAQGVSHYPHTSVDVCVQCERDRLLEDNAHIAIEREHIDMAHELALLMDRYADQETALGIWWDVFDPKTRPECKACDALCDALADNLYNLLGDDDG